MGIVLSRATSANPGPIGLAERIGHSDRIGEENVVAHHGSLSKETRLDAEQRLKAGSVKVCVATASLERVVLLG